MAASVFDSTLFARLFAVGDAGRLFTDSAAVRAMLLVEGALAKVQGELGVIPQISGAAIHRASLEIAVDPGALAQATGQNGVPVPALVSAFRAEMNAPEHAQYVHWGATSQDIMDTALMLRLRQLVTLVEQDLRAILDAMATQAEQHAALPVAARTYGQHATLTTWGAILAEWGTPLIDALEALPALRARSLWVSLSGAAGTAAELTPVAETRAALATALGLEDPERSWHTDRTPILAIVDWLGQISATLGHMGQSLIGLAQSGIAEVSLATPGSSSTMPQKQNPVGPSALLALAHHFTGLRASLQTASLHQHQRDGAAWFTEWMVLPQLALSAAASCQTALALSETLRPNVDRMEATVLADGGFMQAEALSFALSAQMPRPDAQAQVKQLCAEARDTGTPLETVVRRTFPDIAAKVFDQPNLGSAPADAEAFRQRVRALT